MSKYLSYIIQIFLSSKKTRNEKFQNISPTSSVCPGFSQFRNTLMQYAVHSQYIAK